MVHIRFTSLVLDEFKSSASKSRWNNVTLIQFRKQEREWTVWFIQSYNSFLLSGVNCGNLHAPGTTV
jgi:hypothetical protein